MEGDLDKVAEGNEDWVALLRGFYGPFATELAEAENKLPQARTARRADRRDLPELRPADGHQDRPLRALHLVHRLSRVQDDEADRQRHRRQVSQRRRHDRRTPVEEGPHVLRLRQLSEVRFRLVGPRRSPNRARSAAPTSSPRPAAAATSASSARPTTSTTSSSMRARAPTTSAEEAELAST